MNRSYSKIRHIQEANHRLEKRLFENVITEEEEIDEANPITGLIKSASKKIGQYVDDTVNYFKKPTKTPQYFDEIPGYKPKSVYVPKNVPPSLGNVLSKYGEQTWNQTLNSALQTVRDEVFVLTKSLTRLKSEVQDPKLLIHVEARLDDLINPNMSGSLTMSKGTYDFFQSFSHLASMGKHIDELIATKKVTPKALEILELMKKDLDDAAQKLQTVFLDTLRK